MESLIGQQFEEVLLKERLEENLNGTLFLGENASRPVWVHLFPPLSLSDPQQEFFEHLIDEVKKAKHPLLNSLQKGFVTSTYYGFFSEAPEGKPLTQAFQAPLSSEKVREWMISISQGLRLLQQKNIFLPQLSPSQVYISERGLQFTSWATWTLFEKMKTALNDTLFAPPATTRDIRNVVGLTYYFFSGKDGFSAQSSQALEIDLDLLPAPFLPLFENPKEFADINAVLDFFRKLKIDPLPSSSPSSPSPSSPLAESIKGEALATPPKKGVTERLSRQELEKSTKPSNVEDQWFKVEDLDGDLIQKGLPNRSNDDLNQRLYKATKHLNQGEKGKALRAIYPAILTRPTHDILLEFVETLQDGRAQMNALEQALLDAIFLLGSKPLEARKIYEKAIHQQPQGTLLQEALLRTYPPTLTPSQRTAILTGKGISESPKTTSESPAIPSFSKEDQEQLLSAKGLLFEGKSAQSLQALYPLFLKFPEHSSVTPVLQMILKEEASLPELEKLLASAAKHLFDKPQEAILCFSRILELHPGNPWAIQGLQKITTRTAKTEEKKAPSPQKTKDSDDLRFLKEPSSPPPPVPTYVSFVSERKKEEIRKKRKYRETKEKKEKPKAPKYVKLSAQQRAQAHVQAWRKERAKAILSQIKYSPLWILSILVHMVLVTFFAFFLLLLKEPSQPPYIFKVSRYIPAIEPEKEEKKEEIKEEKKEETKEETEGEAEEPLPSVESIGVVTDPSKPRGASSGAGNRGAGKGNALKTFGGSAESEEAVRLGLQWLQRHQMSDGSWRAIKFDRMCSFETPCTGLAHEEEYKDDDYDTAYTALAMLCFLGAGYTHLDPPQEPHAKGYDEILKKAMDYLLKNQLEQGYYGPLRKHEMSKHHPSCNMYVHGVSTLAMCEAYWITKDPALRKSVERALKLIEETQQTRGGWDYFAEQTGRSDTSISGWMVMAMKSAKLAGLSVNENTWKKAKEYFRWAELDTGKYRYADQGPPSFSTTRRGAGMAAVGLLCRIYLEGTQTKPEFRKTAEYLLKNPPDFQRLADYQFKPGTEDEEYLNNNMYYWYYSTLALFQMGGKFWKGWNEKLREMLIAKQRKEGCEKGSWSPVGQWLEPVGGRLYSTTMNILNLEVYYRYLPIYQQQQDDSDPFNSKPHFGEWRRMLNDEKAPLSQHFETLKKMSQSKVEGANEFTARKLIEFLEKEGKKENQYLLLQTLFPLNQDGVLRDLMRLYRKEHFTYTEAQKEIVREIGEYRDPSTIPFLIEDVLLKSLSSKEVIQEAYSALNKITSKDLPREINAWKVWYEQNPPSPKDQAQMLVKEMLRVVTEKSFKEVLEEIYHFEKKHKGTPHLESVLQKYPDFYDRRLALLLKAGDLSLAKMLYDKIIKQFDKSGFLKRWKLIVDAIENYEKGLTEYEKNNYKEALRLMEQALIRYLDFDLAHDYRLFIYRKGWASESLIEKALQFKKGGDLERCIELCKEVLKENKKHEEALKILEECEKTLYDPERLAQLKNKAESAETQKDWLLAFTTYTELFSLLKHELQYKEKIDLCERELLKTRLTEAIEKSQEVEAKKLLKQILAKYPKETEAEQLYNEFIQNLIRGTEVLIAAGFFKFNTDSPDAPATERPMQEIEIPAFFIDKYEVTRDQYYRFCQEKNRETPPSKDWKKGSPPPQGTGSWPVTDVTYDDAESYAKWAGKRIPTHQEWQKAARGFSDTKYPWGDYWDPERGNFSKRLHNVGSFKGDLSVYQVMDLGGSVAEWTFLENKKEKKTLLKGGAYSDKTPQKSATTTGTYPYEIQKSSSFIGFRCVRDDVPEKK